MTEETKDGASLEAARQRAERLQRRRRQQASDPNQQQAFFSSGEESSSGGPTNLVRPVALRRPVPVRPTPVRPSPVRASFQQGRLHRPTAVRQSSWHQGAASLSNSRTASGRKMKSAKSLERKYKKPSWYHQVAAKNRLGAINEDAFALEETSSEETTNQPSATGVIPAGTQQAKQDLLDELNSTGGDSNTPAFQAALQTLLQDYNASHFDPRKPVPRYATACAGNQMEGIGISAGKPTFPGCIGRNAQGDPMYKLGTMSFDMFCPTQLVVSVQGTFVLIDTVDGRNPHGVKNVPPNLLADVRFGRSPVRTYDIVTPFTIEAWRPEFGQDSPNKGVVEPIRGVLTSYGFILPYPTQNRFSVWFTGGSLEVDDQKNEKWFQIFDKDAAPKRTAAESDKLAAVKRLLGASNNNDEMDQEGKLTYSLSKPQASHIDLLYLDKSLQVLRGSSGTVYVHVRLPGSKAVQDSFRSSESLLPATLDPLSLCNGGSDHVRGSASSHKQQQQQQHEKEDRCDPCSTDYAGNQVLFPSFQTPGEPRRGVRRAQSTSNIRHATPVLHSSHSELEDVSTPEARLRELESFVVEQSQASEDDGAAPRSCLKKTSSYGELEELGTNIPISQEAKVWMALPKPQSQTIQQEKTTAGLKKGLSAVWRRLQLRRTLSDTDAIKDGSEQELEDVTECCSTDSEEEVKPKSSSGTIRSQTQLRKSVSFSCLEIRNYNVTVGDNPSCSSGPPVSLDWTYGAATCKIPLSKVDSRVVSSRPCRMTSMERQFKLRKEFGVGINDIKAASKAADQVKQQREFTNRYRSTASSMKVEEALESVQRKAKRAVGRFQKPKPKNGLAGVA